MRLRAEGRTLKKSRPSERQEEFSQRYAKKRVVGFAVPDVACHDEADTGTRIARGNYQYATSASSSPVFSFRTTISRDMHGMQ